MRRGGGRVYGVCYDDLFYTGHLPSDVSCSFNTIYKVHFRMVRMAG